MASHKLEMTSRPKLTGGKPITYEEAVVSSVFFFTFFHSPRTLIKPLKKSLKELRKVVFGSSSAPPRGLLSFKTEFVMYF